MFLINLDPVFAHQLLDEGEIEDEDIFYDVD